MGAAYRTAKVGTVRPKADAVVTPPRNAETCPACQVDGGAVLVEVDGAPLYGLCHQCNHRWHIWPMSGRYEGLRRAAQIELDALNPTGVTNP